MTDNQRIFCKNCKWFNDGGYFGLASCESKHKLTIEKHNIVCANYNCLDYEVNGENKFDKLKLFDQGPYEVDE